MSSLALAAPAGPAAPQQAELPQLGDAAREDLTPVLERRLGEEIMRDIRRDRDYLDDDVLIEYLNQIGNNLVAARPGARGDANFDYFFFAVRDPAINAFALPGGFIAVHSALLLAAQNESELASVLSHEIGHVAQRHIARMLGQQRQDALIPLAAMVLAVLAARSSQTASDVPIGVLMGGQGLAIQRQLNFSRDAEREADRVGFQIMTASGFDTSGMVAFFGRLQTAMRVYSDVPSWLLSHPLTQERIADMQARIREAPYRQRADSIDFHLARARTRVLQDTSDAALSETRKFFETQLQQESRQQKTAAQYGLACLALQRGQLAEAQQWLDAAQTTYAKPRPGVLSAAASDSDAGAIFALTALEVKLAPGQPPAVLAAALDEARAAHARYPLARGIARRLADALYANGRYEEAAAYLRDQVQQYRSEPKLHDALAKTYAAQGKIALQHLSLAESYVLQGGTMAALDQLALARKAPDATFYDQAIIDARERELLARRKEEMKEKKQNG
nr:M48 family metalloprotease [Massilia sp. TS11]